MDVKELSTIRLVKEYFYKQLRIIIDKDSNDISDDNLRIFVNTIIKHWSKEANEQKLHTRTTCILQIGFIIGHVTRNALLCSINNFLKENKHND